MESFSSSVTHSELNLQNGGNVKSSIHFAHCLEKVLCVDIYAVHTEGVTKRLHYMITYHRYQYVCRLSRSFPPKSSTPLIFAPSQELVPKIIFFPSNHILCCVCSHRWMFMLHLFAANNVTRRHQRPRHAMSIALYVVTYRVRVSCTNHFLETDELRMRCNRNENLRSCNVIQSFCER